MLRIRWFLLIAMCIILTTCNTLNINQSKKSNLVKLYVLDCGHISASDIGVFSSNGEYDGKSHELVVTCFLVRHPKGDLLWDAGLPDSLNALPDGEETQGAKLTVPVTLNSQLTELGLAPSDIEYFAPSHSHFDHVGNARLFAGSKLIIRELELDFMFGLGQEMGLVQKELVDPLRESEKILIEGDYDVFGDGSVTIVSTPGHTPGHSVLFVQLENSGMLALTGDLYHLEESRERRITPQFNFSRPETLASMTAFENRVAQTGARVIIQHSQIDRDSLPTVPEYLD